MIADCETCERRNVPCSGCEESQRTICFLCQGDVADPYCELESDGGAAQFAPTIRGLAAMVEFERANGERV